MIARINTVAFQGIEVLPVDVQAQVAAGLPGFTMMGPIATHLIRLMRWSCLFLLLWTGSMSRADAADCPLGSSDETLLQKGQGFGMTIVAVAVKSDKGRCGIEQVKVLFQDQETCRLIHEEKFKQQFFTEVHFNSINFDSSEILHIEAMAPGVSDFIYLHMFFKNSPNGLIKISLPDLQHSNMGGFYAGPLGPGKGSGIVVWDALWEDGSHYAPHRYRFTYYQWSKEQFHEIESVETPSKFEDEPDEVAAKLGLPFRTQAHIPACTLGEGP